MSALNRNLNPAQFMPIEQIGALRSQVRDETGRKLSVEESYHHPNRWDDAEQRNAQYRGYDSAQEYHEALRTHISGHGMANPVRFDQDDLMNGHHRYYVARDLGYTHIEAEHKHWRDASPDPKVTGWDC